MINCELIFFVFFCFPVSNQLTGMVYYRHLRRNMSMVVPMPFMLSAFMQEPSNDTEDPFEEMLYELRKKGPTDFEPTDIIVITFYQIGYQASNETNTFQIVLLFRDDTLRVYLNYGFLNSTNALIGYNFGPSNFREVPLSRTANSNIYEYMNLTFGSFRSLCPDNLLMANKSNQGSLITMNNMTDNNNMNMDMNMMGQFAMFIQPVSGQGIILNTIYNDTSMHMAYFAMFSNNMMHTVMQTLMYNIMLGQESSIHYGEVHIGLLNQQTVCRSVMFEKYMESPVILVHSKVMSDMIYDNRLVTNVWMTNVSKSGFEVCSQQLIRISPPANLTVHYLATNNSNCFFSEVGKLYLMEKMMMMMMPMTSDKYCFVLNFTNYYQTPPNVHITAESLISSEIMSWIEKVENDKAIVCAIALLNGMMRNPSMNATIHYMIKGEVGERDVCMDYQCPLGEQCEHINNTQPFCRCRDRCDMDDKSPICGSNGYTYHSLCEFYRMKCLMKMQNLTIIHLGPCKGRLKVL